VKKRGRGSKKASGKREKGGREKRKEKRKERRKSRKTSGQRGTVRCRGVERG
jgi:hypothetical protein